MTEEQVFLAVLDLADPADRAAYLDRACGGDAEFRRQVEELLAAHFKPGDFLDQPVAEQLAAGSATPNNADTAPYANRKEAAVAGEKKTDEETNELPFLQPSSRPDSLGRIGHYEVLQVLGKGGFGIVLRAFDEALRRVVALKVLAPAMAATSPARKRFLREARSSAQVRHDNVIDVHAVEEQPLPYLVMEFIPGETLQQRLDRTGPLDVPETLRVGLEVAEGLAAAHAQGLVHRDIKPGNILIEAGRHGRAKLTDFGLARAADDASISQSGIVAGTPMYMAPEQARGDALDHRADLFSLGSVLYTMLAGHPPFRANHALAVLVRVVEDTPRPLREIIPETPEWLCRIVEKLQAKDPAERFPSAREVADVLADCEQQVKAHGVLRDFSRIPGGKPRNGRRRLAGWLAAAAALAVIGVSLAWRPHWVNEVFAPRSSVADSGAMRTSENSSEPPPALAPFEPAEAKAHQEQWAKHLGVPVEFTNSVGMKFRLIPPGEFTRGTPPEEIEDILPKVPEWAHEWIRSEAPARKVQIPAPFYLATTAVTVGQFKQFAAAKEYKTVAEMDGTGGIMWTGERNENRPEFTWRYLRENRSDSYPVDLMCAVDAREFCRWLRSVDGLGYDLPDEERWEYACRAGTVTPWSCGCEPAELERHGLTGWDLNFRGRPVGQKPANHFGLFDVHGNATEICRRLDGGYVRRAGGGGVDIWLVRSAFRIPLENETESWKGEGFRVAITSDLKKVAEVAASMVGD